MVLIEKKMNLFDLPDDYTLVHCISEDCKMGAGIAKAFNTQFIGMKGTIQGAIYRNDYTYPFSYMYKGRYQNVINMITKKYYYHKPTFDDFCSALEEVVLICIENDIKKLGMPRIGCGLDKLLWECVKPTIEECFKDIDIEIIVCSL